mmetsp:Transcript_57971/g.136631  ORF Transcript_57971/g.136631 Transcript_57971/m.136631 type:complete len:553 (+) Transcript_57971:114-1772(+)
MAANAALIFNRPVRLVVPRSQDSKMTGGRQELAGTFDVAYESDGRVRALAIELDMGAGHTLDFSKVHAVMISQTLDMVYNLPNVVITIRLRKTHTAPRTATRAPAHLEASMIVETVMDTVASHLNLAPEAVREANFMRPGLLTTMGLKGGFMPPALTGEWTHTALWNRLKAVSQLDKKRADAAAFNSAHKYRKRGVAATPAKYGMFRLPGHVAKVDLMKDGTVTIATGGSEIGQGLHTKVGQVACATFNRILGAAPTIADVRFADFTTENLPNAPGAGGSTTTEACCFAVEEAVTTLATRMATGRKKAAKAGSLNWATIVTESFKGVPMPAFESSAMAMYRPPIKDLMYETFGAAATEVEIDLLTGETKILSTDLMFDLGPSINPAIDIGQIEGAYVMGVGQMLFEGVKFSSTDGKCLTTNTWDYKVPGAADIPQTFNLHLVDLEDQAPKSAWPWILWFFSTLLAFFGLPWKASKGRREFRSGKATGEPPLLLAYSVVAAVRQALTAAVGPLPSDVVLPTPITPEVISDITWAKGDTLDQVGAEPRPKSKDV